MTVKDATRAFCWQHVSSWCHDLEITAADKRDPPWILFPPAATWSCLKTNYSPPCEFKTFSAKFQLPEHLKTKASLALACSCTCRHTCVTEDSVGEDLWEEVSPVEENGTELKWWHCQRSSIDSLGMMVHSGQILETKLCKTKKLNFFLFVFVVEYYLNSNLQTATNYNIYDHYHYLVSCIVLSSHIYSSNNVFNHIIYYICHHVSGFKYFHCSCFVLISAVSMLMLAFGCRLVQHKITFSVRVCQERHHHHHHLFLSFSD